MGSTPITRPSNFKIMKFSNFKSNAPSILKVIQSKPDAPSRRHYKYLQKFLLCKQTKLIKSLNFKIRQCMGRSSNTGHITMWNRGGGCKKLYRQLNFNSTKDLGIVLFSFYDPNRSSFISVFFDFLTYRFKHVLAVNGVVSGVLSIRSPKIIGFKLGFSGFLENHPSRSIFNSLTLNLKKGPQYAVAGGTFCQLLQSKFKVSKVRLPSNQIIEVSSLSYGTLGVISNTQNNLVVLGKAGRKRLKGSRPHVRGIAMNPVDHPHGGRTKGGRDWVTPWGKPFRFGVTSHSKRKKIYKLL
jgi:large subunit ribosomal protein L2